MLIDEHLHLMDLRDLNFRDAILRESGHSRPGRFFCNTARPEDWSGVSEIASRDPRIIPFFGVHPWYADQAGEGWAERLEHYLRQHGSGVGEIGLDRGRRPETRTVNSSDQNGRGKGALGGASLLDRQKKIFSTQLKIAKRLGRPSVLHCVHAWGELLAMLRSHGAGRFMVHSFSGSKEVMRELLDLGGFVSFSWKGLREGHKKTEELVRSVPKDRLLLETDFPDTESGRQDFGPATQKYFFCLRETYKIAARIRETDEEELEGGISRNGEIFLHGTYPR
jgi:TatD DNase family protein